MSAKKAVEVIRPADLPAPPQAAMEIMRACADAKVSNKVLSVIVSNDPVLSAALLRVVNSPFFGFGREISNITHAVTLLGHNALRNLVLCISVRDALNARSISGFDVNLYWEDALRRAVAAKQLAIACETKDHEDCFTKGLLQDFGLLVLMHLFPDRGYLWPELRAATPVERMRIELANYQVTHDQIMQQLAVSWNLPDDIAQPIACHHSLDALRPAATEQLLRQASVLHCADWLVCVYTTEAKNEILTQARELAGNELGLSSDQVDACLAAMPEGVEETGRALGFRVGAQQDFDTILKQANLTLAEENLSYQELTWRLHNALRERDRYADELNRELALAREIQQNLLPRQEDAGLPVHGINIPAKILSGDFYDYFRLDDGRVYFNLADVSGKGITAALLMAKACSLFHCLAKQGHEPASLLSILNNEIAENAIRGMFVTMIAGSYDPGTDEVNLVNAGHLPALVLRKDMKVVEIPAQSPPLGVMCDWKFKEIRFKLNASSIYAFTDGLTEHKLKNGNMLGLAGFKKIITRLARHSAVERLRIIIDYVAEGNALTAKDDITMLLLERRSGH